MCYTPPEGSRRDSSTYSAYRQVANPALHRKEINQSKRLRNDFYRSVMRLSDSVQPMLCVPLPRCAFSDLSAHLRTYPTDTGNTPASLHSMAHGAHSMAHTECGAQYGAQSMVHTWRTQYGAQSMAHTACCTQYGAQSMAHTACCTKYGAHSKPHTVCPTQHAANNMVHTACRTNSMPHTI